MVEEAVYCFLTPARRRQRWEAQIGVGLSELRKRGLVVESVLADAGNGTVASKGVVR